MYLKYLFLSTTILFMLTLGYSQISLDTIIRLEKDDIQIKNNNYSLSKEFIHKRPLKNKYNLIQTLDSIGFKYGLINHKGVINIPPVYDSLDIAKSGNQLIKVAKIYTEKGNQKWYGLINLRNEIVIPIAMSQLVYTTQKNWLVQNKQGKWLVYDSTGSLSNTAEYDSVLYFPKNGLWVRKYAKWGKIDAKGKQVIVPQYKKIKVDSSHQLIVQTFPQIDYLDSKGKIILQFSADSIKNYNKGIWVYFQNELCGIRTFQNDSKAIYQFIGRLINNRAVVGKNGKYGLMNDNGKIILPIQYDSVMIDESEYIRVKSKTGWGIIDKIYFSKISCKYPFIKNISNGLSATLNEEGKWGYLNVVGDTVVPFMYSSAGDFNAGIAYVNTDDSCYVINKKGEVVVSGLDITRFKAGVGEIVNNQPVRYTFPHDYYDEYTLLGGKLCMVKCGNQYGLLNKSGVELFPPIGDTIINDPLHKIAIYHCDTMAGIANYWGEYNQPLLYNFDTICEFNQNCAVARKKGYWGGIDLLKNIRVAPQYEAMKGFSNGYWGISINNKWGFTDLNENIVVQPNYENIQAFNKHSAGVKYKGRWNTISNQNKLMNESFYDSICPSPHQSWILLNEGYQGLTDTLGREIIVCRYEKINDLGQGLAQVWKHNKTGIIDYFQNTIVPITYDTLSFDNTNRMYYVLKKDEEIDIKE